MRIKIRDQLTAFVLTVTLTSIGVLAIVTWYNNHNLVISLRKTRLQLIASFKSEQISADLQIYNNAATGYASRAMLVNAIKRYENGNHTSSNWVNALTDLGLVLSSNTQYLQMSVYNANMSTTFLNITSATANATNTTNFVPILDTNNDLIAYNSLGGHPNFPGGLYPNTTYPSGAFLGPMNSTYNASGQVASITAPIYNNTTVSRDRSNIIGYLTLVFTTDLLTSSLGTDTSSMGKTGELVLVGPASGNLVPADSGWPGNISWRYVVPPSYYGEEGKLGGYWHDIARSPHAGSTISTKDPARNNRHVAIGWNDVSSSLVNWTLIVEQDYSEVSGPINHLRTILLATVFGMSGGVFILTCVLASFAARPISRLKDATEQTTRPPTYERAVSHRRDRGDDDLASNRKQKWWHKFYKTGTKEIVTSSDEETFKIPGRVPDRKHYVTDELTELTKTFNSMTDEITKQYLHLEERVNLRTVELREQTQLANAANEAKSMFIANVTHELRTPLNGIMGMCSIVMSEPGLPGTVRRSLNTIYKSGELLLCLLTDLLTFSRNQVAGVNVVLEEGEFKVKELVSQVKAIFAKTARDKKVELTMEVVNDGIDASTGKPSVHGILRGDLNRILQVVINLVSNSLKFTPENGSVHLRIAMVQDLENVILPKRMTDTNKRKMSKAVDINKTAIINPKTAANQAVLSEKARQQSSLQTPTTTPAPGSDSSAATAVAYFNPESLKEEAAEEKIGITDPLIETRWFEFAVIDTGPGIPEHMHSQIFEPFVQGDLGLSKKYGGTGLGLSICKQLAELMEGVIELKSFEGAGSTFTLRIPMKAGGKPQLRAPTQSRPASMATTRFSAAVGHRRPVDTMSINSDMTSFSSLAPNRAPDATRLVGLSQPYFARELADDETEDANAPSASRSLPAVEQSPRHSMNISLPAQPGISPAMKPTSPHTPGQYSSISKKDYFFTSDVPLPASPEPVETPGRGVKTVRMAEDVPNVDTKSEATITPARPPKAARATKPPAKSTEKKEPSSLIRVLVAEDNKVNQQVVKGMLKLENVTDVTISEDGQQAIDKVKEALEAEKKYELIFMDIQMPNVDGLQATRAIRGMGYQGPIIALTAFAEEQNVKDCFDNGIDYFLAKPVGRKQLKEVIKQYCPPSPIIEEESSHIP